MVLASSAVPYQLAKWDGVNLCMALEALSVVNLDTLIAVDLLYRFTGKKAFEISSAGVDPLRAQGNQAHKLGNWAEATRLYSLGLLRDSNRDVRHIFFGNRAAASLQLANASASPVTFGQRAADDALVSILCSPTYAKAWYRRWLCTGSTSDSEIAKLLTSRGSPDQAILAARHILSDMLSGASKRNELQHDTSLIRIIGSRPVDSQSCVGEGLALEATRDIQPGTVLLDDPPQALVSLESKVGDLSRTSADSVDGVWSPLADNRCSRCTSDVPVLDVGGSKLAHFYPCANAAHCGLVYCSAACMAKDWVQHHRFECEGRPQPSDSSAGCRAMGFLHYRILPREVVLAMRLARTTALATPAQSPELLYHVKGVPHQQLAELLVTACVSIQLIDRVNEELSEVPQGGCNVDPGLLEPDAPGTFDALPTQQRVTALLKALLQLRANTIAVRHVSRPSSAPIAPGESTDEQVALAVYRTACMANHSCEPNAFVSFSREGGRALLVALRQISAGEQVTISYFPLAQRMPDTRARQECLQHKYSFTCQCSACTDGQDAARKARFARYSRLWDSATAADAAGLHGQAAIEKAEALCALGNVDAGDDACTTVLALKPYDLVRACGATVREELESFWHSLHAAGPPRARHAERAAELAAGALSFLHPGSGESGPGSHSAFE